MKPRVTACSRRYSHIPRINAHSVHDLGRTLHTGIQLADACWCWSQTEHGTPGSLLILVIAGSAPTKLGSFYTLTSAGVI